MKTFNVACFAVVAFAACILAVCGTSIGDVVINEVEISPPDNGSMWVELYNSGDQAVNIGNWQITIISKPWVGPMVVPNGTELLPKKFYVDEGDSKWDAVDNATIRLTDSQGNKVNETPLLSDTVHNDFTMSRVKDGVNTDSRSDWSLTRATKGRSNNGTEIA